MCAIWEGYILNPPARGWSPPYRRPLPLFNMSSRPASCRPSSAVLPSSALPSCRLLSCAVVASGVIVWRLVTRLPGRPVAWSSVRVWSSWRLFAPFAFAPIFRPSLFPYSPSQKSIPLREISASFQARFNPYFSCPDFTRSMLFWQDYSFSFYSQRPSGH